MEVKIIVNSISMKDIERKYEDKNVIIFPYTEPINKVYVIILDTLIEGEEALRYLAHIRDQYNNKVMYCKCITNVSYFDRFSRIIQFNKSCLLGLSSFDNIDPISRYYTHIISIVNDIIEHQCLISSTKVEDGYNINIDVMNNTIMIRYYDNKNQSITQVINKAPKGNIECTEYIDGKRTCYESTRERINTVTDLIGYVLFYDHFSYTDTLTKTVTISLKN